VVYERETETEIEIETATEIETETEVGTETERQRETERKGERKRERGCEPLIPCIDEDLRVTHILIYALYK